MMILNTREKFISVLVSVVQCYVCLYLESLCLKHHDLLVKTLVDVLASIMCTNTHHMLLQIFVHYMQVYTHTTLIL